MVINEITCKWDNCNLEFYSEIDRFNHIKKDHIQTETRKCKWEGCEGKVNANRWNLISHLKRHLNLIFGVCHICDRPFKRASEYKLHFKTHTDSERILNSAALILLG
eukprot:NODE_122_length_18870_cov_0.236908.p14 type:complete len:107 gc:universal NODE_122_length_18870_cov_0.236908:13838-14158(+)